MYIISSVTVIYPILQAIICTDSRDTGFNNQARICTVLVVDNTSLLSTQMSTVLSRGEASLKRPGIGARDGFRPPTINTQTMAYLHLHK